MTGVTTNRPSSLEEKRQNDDFIHRRWLYVHELRAMLDEFKDDDWVEINMVKNLNIGRGDNPQYATIDMLWVSIERWSEQDVSREALPLQRKR